MDNYFIQVEPVVDLRMKSLCVKPYPLHRKGCPNFGKKQGCPPKCPIITDTLDLSKPVYAIYNRFDIASHVENMKQKHPDWSERQLYCVLYWQPKARKQLREKIKEFLKQHRGLKIVSCPEAQCVNLTDTVKAVGIELEWPPRKYAYQIVLAGEGR